MRSINSVWSEDQSNLLRFSLHNILSSINKPNYKSEKYYLATPFNTGYRRFDIEESNIEEMIFKGTELLKRNNFSKLNLENIDGFPILSIHLEPGPTIIIKDIVTEEIICNILL